MRVKHTGIGLLLALACVTSSCSKSDQQNLVGRWKNANGPNMIFNEDGTVYSIFNGPRRKGRYYLDTESDPKTIIMDMRKSTLKAVLYFEYASYTKKHLHLTPTFTQRIGEKKKEARNKRKMILERVDPNDPISGENRFTAKATPEPRD